MSSDNYSLKEGKGFRGLLHKLFFASNQPYIPKLKVKCTFYRQDLSLFTKIAEVDCPKWHFEPIVVNGIVTEEKLVIDSGCVTFQDKEKYLTIGTPPLHFLFNSPFPCPSWMVKLLKEGKNAS